MQVGLRPSTIFVSDVPLTNITCQYDDFLGRAENSSFTESHFVSARGTLLFRNESSTGEHRLPLALAGLKADFNAEKWRAGNDSNMARRVALAFRSYLRADICEQDDGGSSLKS
jgi:hypothetical protein